MMRAEGLIACACGMMRRICGWDVCRPLSG